MTFPRERFLSLTLLVLIIALASFLRFDHLGEPSYWLDEVLSDLGTTHALSQPWWRWLTGFDAEHGPLSFAVQFATRIAGRDEFAGRLAAALLGIAAIPLAWLAARLAGERAAGAAAAAALLALSPLHVYYSREARPYALLMLLTAALLVELLRDGRAFSVLLVALLYTSAVAAPVVAAAAITAWLLGRRRQAIAAAVVTLAFPLLYRGGPSSQPDAPFPHLDGHFFVRLLKGFTVSAFGADIDGRTMIVVCALAVIGAVVMARRDRRTAIAVLAMTLLPVVFAIASLMVFDHWFALRYVCAGVVGFLVLAGAGIAFVSRAFPIALIVTAAIGWQTWPTVQREPYQKLDWRRIASTIARYARPGDLILAAEPSTGIVLPYYLAPYRRERDVIQMSVVPLAARMVDEHPATWLVSAGTAHGSVRQWMCRYPVVLASELDGFRMHYASPTGDFLRERAQAPELRALDAALGAHAYTLDLNDDRWLGEGWASSEGAFRWATGKSASVVVPRWGIRDRVIRVQVLPMDHPSLPRQTMRVAINGHVIGDVTLPNAWTEQSFAAPARVWINGLNTLTFTFGRARAPASLDPNVRDERELAVNFDRIEILDAGAAASAAGLDFGGRERTPLHIASAFIDEKTAWRNTPPRLPNRLLRRDTATALLGRLGFDSELAWPRLERNELDLDDLATSLAAGSDCEDDRAFIARVFAVLFERAPIDPEMHSLLGKLRAGDSRAMIVRHLFKAPQLRERYVNP